MFVCKEGWVYDGGYYDEGKYKFFKGLEMFRYDVDFFFSL